MSDIGASDFFVVRFPHPWPVAQQICLYSCLHAAITIELFAFVDGHLRVSILENGTEIFFRDFQKIQVLGTGRSVVAIIVDNHDTTLYVDGRPLLRLDDAQDTVHTVVAKDVEVDDTSSFDHPDALIACKEWVDWRKSKYLNPKPHTKKSRRGILISEEVSQLETSLKSLNASVASINRGEEHYWGHIATEVRALVYWNGKAYNPLLLRVAGRFSLPLPIYMLEDDDSVGPPNQDLYADINLHDPSFFKSWPLHKLVDLQKWLSSTGLTLRDANVDVKDQEITIKDLILTIATTQGSAHYDDDVDIRLDWLNAVKAFNISQQNSLLLEITSIVLEMGQYVLNKAVL